MYWGCTFDFLLHSMLSCLLCSILWIILFPMIDPQSPTGWGNPVTSRACRLKGFRPIKIRNIMRSTMSKIKVLNRNMTPRKKSEGRAPSPKRKSQSGKLRRRPPPKKNTGVLLLLFFVRKVLLRKPFCFFAQCRLSMFIFFSFLIGVFINTFGKYGGRFRALWAADSAHDDGPKSQSESTRSLPGPPGILLGTCRMKMFSLKKTKTSGAHAQRSGVMIGRILLNMLRYTLMVPSYDAEL